MKELIFCMMFIFTLNASASEKTVYQVINQDPHLLPILQAHMDTEKQEGRLWLVSQKKNLPVPTKIQQMLKRVNPAELKHFLYLPSTKDLKLPEQNILHAFESLNRDRFKQNVLTLSSVQNRKVKTEDNQEITAWLQRYVEQLGFTTTTVCYATNACSVVAEKKGTTAPDKIILVEAHFDSVGALKAGADDNASGAAGILELAHAISENTSEKTVRFFLTNGEEQGLLGANDYVQKLSEKNELKNIMTVINMDMIGYNSNGIVELETDPPYETLAKRFAELAARYTRLKTKITLGAWGSDHVPFLKKGVPAILTIEDWSTKTPCYHRACDLPETMNNDYAIEILKMNLAAILEG